MNNLDALDAARGGPMTYRHRGIVTTAPHPADLGYQTILLGLQHEVMPGEPGAISLWKSRALFERWQARYDLPEFTQANRLAYVVDHYIDTLTYDLQTIAGVDLGELWRTRRWNTLLALIDRLPRHSLYYEAVANDPEHAAMVAESMEAGDEREDPGATSGPPLSTWTPEVEAIVRLTDVVKALHVIIPASQGAKGLQDPKPEPRPRTALEAARRASQYKRRMAEHNALAARLLPHKYPKSDETPR